MRIWLVYFRNELKIKEFQSIYSALQFVKFEKITDYAVINGQYIESSIQ